MRIVAVEQCAVDVEEHPGHMPEGLNRVESMTAWTPSGVCSSSTQPTDIRQGVSDCSRQGVPDNAFPGNAPLKILPAPAARKHVVGTIGKGPGDA